jgi:hypothetical protein
MNLYELIPLGERVAKCLAILREQTQWIHDTTEDFTRRALARSEDLLKDPDMKQSVATLNQAYINSLEDIDGEFMGAVKNMLIQHYGQEAADMALEQHRKG